MDGINVLMKYMGGVFNFSCFRVKDDGLAFMWCFEDGEARVSYVCALQHLNEFEPVSLRYLFSVEDLNDYADNGAPIYAQKANFLHSLYSSNIWPYITISQSH